MKRALIIEDEHLSADRMRKMVEKVSSLNVQDILYSVESANEWFIENESPDIIFLDIQLGDGTGFDVLDKVQTFPYIIFTTAFDEYTLKAFKYNSIDYLLKPIKPEELSSAIQKFEKLDGTHQLESKLEDLRRDLFKDYRSKFLIKTGNRYRSISIDQIAYFFSEGGSTYLKTQDNDSILLDLSLDEIEHQLDPRLFFRVNRHLLVKGEHIQSIDSFFNGRLSLDLDPSFDEPVIVSRPKVKAFKQWLDS